MLYANEFLSKSREFILILQSLGCKVALDDFGAGYTSFAQLKLLPVDVVKIDGIYIGDIFTNPNSMFFVEILCKMSVVTSFKLVAEFVESADIAVALKERGVRYLQGHYFGAASNTKPWLK